MTCGNVQRPPLNQRSVRDDIDKLREGPQRELHAGLILLWFWESAMVGPGIVANLPEVLDQQLHDSLRKSR